MEQLLAGFNMTQGTDPVHRTVACHAFRALAGLELYETRIEAWIADPRQAGRSELESLLKGFRRYCDPCSDLTVPWLALVIAHFELLSAFDAATRQPEGLTQARRRHAGCIRQFAFACRTHLQHEELAGRAGSIARERRVARSRASLHAAGDGSG